ncbi:MAG: phenylalanine--tRNA ligase subunit beta, partial [Bacteroidales bacterium]|nr:phenylalanine--tRNA ligase subunit beta [Bacteroidales bacterium]
KILNDTADTLLLKVPLYRVDVTREADVIEEVLRIYGYNQIDINQQSRNSVNHFDKPDKEKVVNQIADLLTSNGFFEIMANSLSKDSYYEKNTAFDEKLSVKLYNPLSQDLNVMRQSLIFGGLEAIAYNINRKRAKLKFFEFGTCYKLKNKEKGVDSTNNFKEEQKLALLVTGSIEEESWNLKAKEADFYFLKGIISRILQRAGINERNLIVSEQTSDIYSEALKYSINGKELVQFGTVSKATLNQLEIKQTVYFAEFSFRTILDNIKKTKIQFSPLPRYPEVKRDLSLLLDQGVSFEQISELAYNTEKRLLKNVRIFDVYKGEKISNNKKSYAVNFTIQDNERTLTDKQIDKIMRNLIQAFTTKLGAEIR